MAIILRSVLCYIIRRYRKRCNLPVWSENKSFSDGIDQMMHIVVTPVLLQAHRRILSFHKIIILHFRFSPLLQRDCRNKISVAIVPELTAQSSGLIIRSTTTQGIMVGTATKYSLTLIEYWPSQLWITSNTVIWCRHACNDIQSSQADDTASPSRRQDCITL